MARKQSGGGAFASLVPWRDNIPTRRRVFSRRSAKDAKDLEQETRSTKSEIRNKFKMMKNKTITMFQTGRIEFTVLDFLILNLFGPGLFRISIFGFRIFIRWYQEEL